MTGDRVPPTETRGGETPGDWQIAEAAKDAAAELDDFSAAFRDQENDQPSEDTEWVLREKYDWAGQPRPAKQQGEG